MIANEDKQYQDVIRTLNSLQKVKAPAGFEANLMRRINSGNFKPEKVPFWKGILVPQRLIPSSVAAAAVIVMLIIFIPSDNIENPLMTDPRIREDIIATETVIGDENARTPDSSVSGTERYVGSASNRSLLINKSGLNFRQVNLSSEDREQLNRLKEKIRSFITSQPEK